MLNQWVKIAPFGRWDLRFAPAPYPNRYVLTELGEKSKKYNYGITRVS